MASTRKYSGKFYLTPTSNHEFEGELTVDVNKKIIIHFIGEESTFLDEYEMLCEQFMSSLPLEEGWTFLGQLEDGMAVSLIGATPVNNNLLIERNDKKFIVKTLLKGCHFASRDEISFINFRFSCTALDEWLGSGTVCSRISDDFMVEIRNDVTSTFLQKTSVIFHYNEKQSLDVILKKVCGILQHGYAPSLGQRLKELTGAAHYLEMDKKLLRVVQSVRDGASHMLVETNEIEMCRLAEVCKKLLPIAKYVLLTELLFDELDKLRLVLGEGKMVLSLQ